MICKAFIFFVLLTGSLANISCHSNSNPNSSTESPEPSKSPDIKSRQTFTIYFLGTGIHSETYKDKHYWDGETVSLIAGTMQKGEDHLDYIVVDGPGSGNLLNHKRFVHYNHTPHNSSGTALGIGVKENIDNVIAVMKLQNKNPALVEFVKDLKEKLEKRKHKNISKINIVGFSRGAVTAIAFANKIALDAQFKDVPVNIFAIDPVSGPAWYKDIFLLENNVEKFVGLYAQHEFSSQFEAIIPVASEKNLKTHISYLLFPGKHGSMVGDDYSTEASDPSALRSTGKIIKHLACEFLLDNGTQLKNAYQLSKASLLEEYALLVANFKKYEEIGQNITYTTNSSASYYNYKRTVYKGSKEPILYWSYYVHYRSLLLTQAIPSEPGFINSHHKKLSSKR